MLKIFLVCSLAVISIGCTHPPLKAPTSKSRLPAALLETGPTPERPWELIDSLGQTILSDIFYAENAQNEQLMPLTMPNHRLQIDRLIYPTLGNPRLFVRTRVGDSGIFVLRLENEVYQSAGFVEGNLPSGSHLVPADLPPGNPTQLSFYLVKRNKQSADASVNVDNLETGAHDSAPDLKQALKIIPSQIYRHEEFPDMPPSLKARKTIQVTFSKSDLEKVPAGLYDVCFTLTDVNGKIIQSRQGRKIYECQFNSFRLFEQGPEANGDRYSVINISDAQISLGSSLRTRSVNKLVNFVNHINRSTDPKIRNAAFITFNGDLHNSGSPLMREVSTVLNNYNRESWMIVNILKELEFPIFLVLGNHDGYANMTHSAGNGFWQSADEINKQIVKSVLAREGEFRTWPDFNSQVIPKVIQKAQHEAPVGRHLDIFSGRFIKTEGKSGWAAWSEVPLTARNVIAYDGFYQWQKTYGPQYSSFVFGKNRYVNANSFELRQHRRVGWGLYTSNYGGNISAFQMDWIRSEFRRGTQIEQDIIFLAHHDPRGGHRGQDYPYYFKQLDFAGIGPNLLSYVESEVLKNKICDGPLGYTFSKKKKELFCVHDGLQEWMRADKEFDCAASQRRPDGHCDPCKFNLKVPFYSGYALLDLWAKTPRLRTAILGHTHFHSLEVLQSSDAKTSPLIPRHVILDLNAQEAFAKMDPAREAATTQDATAVPRPTASECQDNESNRDAYHRLPDGKYDFNLDQAGFTFASKLEGTDRELTIIRLAPSAEIAPQLVNTDSRHFAAEVQREFPPKKDPAMHGFSLFEIFQKSDSRAYELPQINALTYYLNLQYEEKKEGTERGAVRKSLKREKMIKLAEFELDRAKPLTREDDSSPLNDWFYLKE